MIHIFSPLRTYLLPFFTARVSIPPGFEPNCGSVRPKQPMALPSWSKREPFVFLSVAAVGEDRVHHQAGLNGDETAQAGIAALEFLVHQAVSDVGHAGAAIALQVRAEEAELAELRDEVHRESGFAIVFFDDGEDFVVNELARGLADEFFFVVEQGIEFDEINAGEGWHERLRRARVTKGERVRQGKESDAQPSTVSAMVGFCP